MLFNKFCVALTLAVGFLDTAFAQNGGFNRGGRNRQQNKGAQNGGNNRGDNKSDTQAQNATSSTGNTGNTGNGGNTGTATTGNNAQAVLNPANIQTGSASDGQGQVSGVAAGQSPSAT